MWIHREHRVPPPVHINYRRIRHRYLELLNEGIFHTEEDMEALLRTGTRAKCMTFVFDVPDEIAATTLATESLHQYVQDLKPGEGGEVRGEVCAGAVCVVCREWGTYKIECGHVYHKECIHECAKWKNKCPVCQAPLLTCVVL